MLILVLIAFGMGFYKTQSYLRPSAFPPAHPAWVSKGKPFYRTGFVSTGITRIVHAPSAVELSDGTVSAFWFAGSREGGRDVEIHNANFNPQDHVWSAEKAVVKRLSVQSDLHRYIRRLGNPVVARGSDGKLWLFFVSTSIGGWSTSAVNMMTSEDNGKTWSRVKRLITGPFLNISTLVKTVPFFYRDGTLGLPVYHELFAKFGEIVRLDSAGKIIEKQRLNAKWRTLQPLVLLENSHQAIALMRYSDRQRPRQAIQVFTEDAGQHWSEPFRSMLPNPDSAMTGIVLGKDRMLVVINNNQEQRDDLTLMISDDAGVLWKKVFLFEDERGYRDYEFSGGEFADGIQRLFLDTDPEFKVSIDSLDAVEEVMCDGHPCRYQFDYPYLIRARNGLFHLFYTWNRTYIKHIEFNQAWLEAQIKDATG